MTDLATTVSLILIPFLSGNICSILNRQPKLSVIGRPLARTTLVFCLGVWFLNLPSEITVDPAFNSPGLVPWILLAHLVISFIPNQTDRSFSGAAVEEASLVDRDVSGLPDEPAGKHGLRYDALLYSASFLSAICLSRNLGFLFLFGESLAVSTWLTSTGTDRRRIVKRSLATFVLIAMGTGFILSHTGTTDFSGFENRNSSSADHSDAGRFDQLPNEASLAMKAGLLFIVVGYAWRIGFFPFETLSNPASTLRGFQRQLSLVTSVILLLAILLPRLSLYENLGMMLLITLAVPTLIRESWRSTRREAASQIWECWWIAAAALMWISLGLALYSLGQQSPLGLWLPAGLAAVRLELLSSLCAFIILTAVSHAFTALGYPLRTQDSLTGLIRTTPFYSTVLILGIFSWVGIPALAGFAPRWGALASLFEVAGTEHDGSNYFLLIAIIVLCCQMLLTLLGLSVVQTLCDRCPATRPTDQIPTWSVWPFAVLLFVISISKWM